ncbi:ceramidase domain-containing protein [Aquibium sp. LZ166]|uniref:Ceramidase domain-containing protein n=1 Tax=Aquibium pacificus TaxID=3153579 RepID=A0ABV3SHF8_9HYPH
MNDSILASIDNYCERTGPEFWSEPLNAVTNLAFILAGIWGLLEIRRRNGDAFAVALAWWVIAIGIGSALFHTFANGLTIWFDVVPIATFTLALTLFNIRRWVGFGWGLSLAALVGFFAIAGAITAMLPDWIRVATNGTSGYLPALLSLAFWGLVLIWRGHPAGWYDLVAAAMLVASAFFRTIDPDICEAFPIGTHFLWHTLNGAMLAVLLASVAWHGTPGRDARHGRQVVAGT